MVADGGKGDRDGQDERLDQLMEDRRIVFAPERLNDQARRDDVDEQRGDVLGAAVGEDAAAVAERTDAHQKEHDCNLCI